MCDGVADCKVSIKCTFKSGEISDLYPPHPPHFPAKTTGRSRRILCDVITGKHACEINNGTW